MSAILQYQYRAHTDSARGCRVWRTPPANNTTENLPSCHSSGLPPDLNLTVSLHNISEADEGAWRLELNNDAGKDGVDFYLRGSAGKLETAGDTAQGIQNIAFVNHYLIARIITAVPIPL